MGGDLPITSGGAWLRNWAGRNGLALRRTRWLRWKLISGPGMFANCATWWSAESIVGTSRNCLLPILFSIRMSRLGGGFDPPWTSPQAHLPKQIGRASCTERVRKSVESSGVAVAYKKKYKHQ